MIVAGLGGLIWDEWAQWMLVLMLIGGIGLLSSAYIEKFPLLKKMSSYFEKNGTGIALFLVFIFGLAIAVLDYLDGTPLSSMFGQY